MWGDGAIKHTKASNAANTCPSNYFILRMRRKENNDLLVCQRAIKVRCLRMTR